MRRGIVAAEPINSVDVTPADALAELDAALTAKGIDLCFAELKDPVKDKLKRFGLLLRFGESRFFSTMGPPSGNTARPETCERTSSKMSLSGSALQQLTGLAAEEHNGKCADAAVVRRVTRQGNEPHSSIGAEPKAAWMEG